MRPRGARRTGLRYDTAGAGAEPRPTTERPMFLFRREKPGESSEPLRGRGGGRVRPRPQRKARRRRKMGMADFLMLGLIGGAVVFVIEIWLVHAPVIVALIYAIIVTIISAAFNAWLERRRAAKQPPPPKRRR